MVVVGVEALVVADLPPDLLGGVLIVVLLISGHRLQGGRDHQLGTGRSGDTISSLTERVRLCRLGPI